LLPSNRGKEATVLRKLQQSSGNVLGYEVGGKLTEEEFEAFSEEFRAEISRHGKVRLLIHVSEIPSMESGAMWEDLKLSRYRDDIERYAIVGESALLEWGTKLGDVLIGGEVRHFDPSREEEAWRWIRA
jgi:SpoIIAA-like